MKKIIWMLGLIILPAITFSQQATITLSDFTIKENGKEVPYDKTFKETLTVNTEKDFDLYTIDGVTYGVSFTYKKKGERVKLMHYMWSKADGKKKRVTRRKKEMVVLKTSVKGTYNGKNVENIMIDKHTMSSLYVIFKYQWDYMENR
jgi:hypothetical protein